MYVYFLMNLLLVPRQTELFLHTGGKNWCGYGLTHFPQQNPKDAVDNTHLKQKRYEN